MIKPLSHSKSLVTYFIDASFKEDETIPTFMLKSRMKTLGQSLTNLNKYLDKSKYGIAS